MSDPARSKNGDLRGGFETILDDLSCIDCGYNLKGLSASGVCPECGHDVAISAANRIARGPRKIDQSKLGNAPPAYLFRLCIGLALFGVGGLVTLIMSFVLWSGGIEPATSITALGGGATWFAGVILTVILSRPLPKPTPSKNSDKPSPDAPVIEWFWLKVAACATQSLWLIIPALALMQNSGSIVAAITKHLLMFFAFLGCPAVAVLLSFIADWARDTSIGNRLRACAWCMAFFPIPLVLALISHAAGFPWSGYFLLLVPTSVLFWSSAAVIMLISALQMLTMTFWAVRNAREEEARSRRMIERAKRQRPGEIPESFSSGIPLGSGGILGGSIGTSAPAPSTEPTILPIRPMPNDAPVPGSSTKRINPSDEVTPYKLEDD